VGKSTLSKLLSQRLGLHRSDSDELLALQSGISVQELFLREREWNFRQLEAAVVRSVALQQSSSIGVVSLGGGALLDASLRRSVLQNCWLIGLHAPTHVLHQRINHAPKSRPLLQGADASRVEALVAQRSAAYAECHAQVSAEAAPELVLDAIVSAVQVLEREQPVRVALGDRSYSVSFSAAQTATERIAALRPEVSSVLAVTDRNVAMAPGVAELLRDIRPAATVMLDGNGDSDKTLAQLTHCWTAAVDAGLDRDSLVLAIGGGVVSDLAGFAAATLLRGVRFASIATTVLAMADASVGGKTAIDFGPGKNLIGAFYQPSFVLCAIETLATLSVDERRAGLAEVLKVALVADPGLFDLISENADALRDGELGAIAHVLPRAVQAKAHIVALDERENGPRLALNFGHTLGHAIESALSYELSHGHCVALGIRCALAVGESLGITPAEAVSAPVNKLLDRLGLPRQLPRELDRSSLEAALRRDKKHKQARTNEVREPAKTLQFIALKAIGEYSVVRVSVDQALEALSVLR
jgi:3-dehydroquinate synthase